MSRIDDVSQLLSDEDEAKIDLTPMLDVVFIMLIFFIVTATFVKELGLDVNKPPDVDVVEEDSKSITIQLNANDEIIMNGLVIDKRAVAAQIIRGKAENPEAAVSILAHKRSRADTLVSVVNSIREAGIDESIPINEMAAGQ
jgi:biopolymer transport protein ExbD